MNEAIQDLFLNIRTLKLVDLRCIPFLHLKLLFLWNLTSIFLNNCLRIDDQCIVSLSENSIQNKVIDFENCQRLTDAGKINFVLNSKYLVVLNLNVLNILTENGISCISVNVPMLKVLEIKDTKRVNSCGFTYISIQSWYIYSFWVSKMLLRIFLSGEPNHTKVW